MKLLNEAVESFEIHEERKDGEEPKYYLEGIFLQANIRNRNGRIYPMDVMKPEVERYISTYVNEGRALGELGHPCFLQPFDILTKNGWKPFEEIKVGDKVIGSDENRKYVETTVTQKIDGEEYNGDCYHFKGSRIDSVVTAPHRFYCLDRNDKMLVKTAEELYNNSSHIRIIKNIIPDEVDGETITLKGIDTPFYRNHKVDPREDITFDAKDFCRFLGFWLAEGCLRRSKGKSLGTCVMVSQNEGEYADAYIELIKRMGYKPTITSKTTNPNGTKNLSISFNDARVYKFLEPLGNCYQKYIPDEVKELSGASLIELIRWFGYGDGRSYTYSGEKSRKNKNDIAKNIFTTSKRLINDLYVVAIKSGLSGKIREIEPDFDKDYIFGDHKIFGKNKHTLYLYEISTVSGIHLDRRFVTIEKVPSSGKIYCINTESHNFFVRQNGMCWLTGNCSAGNTPNINLERVSHKIEKIWQDGDYFKARALILDTPYGKIAKELIKSGCKLGVSSRALGSVIRRNGTDYVGKDFRLITAGDIVWEPSAQAAFPEGIVEDVDWEFDEATGEWTKAIPEELDIDRLSKMQADEFAEFLESLKNKHK